MKILASAAAISVLLALCAVPAVAQAEPGKVDRCGARATPLTKSDRARILNRYPNAVDICLINVGATSQPLSTRLFGVVIPISTMLLVYEPPIRGNDDYKVQVQFDGNDEPSFSAVVASTSGTIVLEAKGKIHFYYGAADKVDLHFILDSKGKTNPSEFLWPAVDSRALRGHEEPCDAAKPDIKMGDWPGKKPFVDHQRLWLNATYPRKVVQQGESDACFFYIPTVVTPDGSAFKDLDPQVINHGSPPKVLPAPPTPIIPTPPPPPPINHGTPPAPPQ